MATVVLLIYQQTFGAMAEVAGDRGIDLAMVRNSSPGLHSILALVVLGLALVLGIYKPAGVTGYGRRRIAEHRRARQAPEGAAAAP